MSYFNSCW